MDMVPGSHFMHPHPLVHNFNTKEYLCVGCKTNGFGVNFGCERCSFLLHEFCSRCPTILPSFLHPEHPLSLWRTNTQNMESPRICDVCEDSVEGLFYWCQTCNFIVHPLCTHFPQSLSHPVHPSYLLMFQKSYRNATCATCEGVCNSWMYTSTCDGLNFHVECIAKLYEAKFYEAKSYDTTTRRLPPLAGVYTYGGVNSSANSDNVPRPGDQTTPPSYDIYRYHPYGGVASGMNTHSMYNLHGTVPPGTYAHQPNNFPPVTDAHQPNNFPPVTYAHQPNNFPPVTYAHQPNNFPPGTYAHQPNNFPPGTYAHQPNNFCSHNMNHSGLASGTYQNGNPNSYSMHNPFIGLSSNTNSYSMHNGAPFDSNSQHAQVHQGETSQQAPAHNAETSPAQSQGFLKQGSKLVFRILWNLSLGVISGGIGDLIF